jgi:hypothetical protein
MSTQDKVRYVKVCSIFDILLVNIRRYDYDCCTNTGTLTLRMLSLLHEISIARVVEEVQKSLYDILESRSLSWAFAHSVKHNGSGRLVLKEDA